jgi:hypothetical protein
MNPRVRVALLAVLASLAGGSVARGDEPAKPSLRQSWLTDLPTTISVPLENDTSFVVGLPAHLWIQCPRNGPGPTTFDGDGLVLQDIIDMRSGNSHSLAYVGAVALPRPARGEAFEERFDRFAQFFVADLGKKYARVEFSLATAPGDVKLERTELTIDGKPTAAWRTSRYKTKPTGFANKPNEFLTGEAAFVGDEASNSFLYLVSDSKMGSLNLDQLLTGLSVRKSAAANPTGRRVQLLDIAAGADANYPVRLAFYESPPGFVPTFATIRTREELVYAEDRLDEKARVTASWRIAHRDHVAAKPLAAEAEKERAARGGKGASAPKAVDLGTTGAQALVFSYKTTVGDRAGTASTAVVEFDDKIWSMTWTTFGDEAAVKADQAALEALLHGMQLATR